MLGQEIKPTYAVELKKRCLYLKYFKTISVD